jgi:hypothetical protein
MTRDAARKVERQLRKRYPGGTVDVARVFGGVQVQASDGRGWVFLRADDDSPLLALFGADPGTGNHDSPGPAPGALPDPHRLPRGPELPRAGGRNPCLPVAVRDSRGSRSDRRGRAGPELTSTHRDAASVQDPCPAFGSQTGRG